MCDLRAQTALLLVCVEESRPAPTAKKTGMLNYGGLGLRVDYVRKSEK